MNRESFFQYWYSATESIRNGSPLPPIADGKPQGGYYRMRQTKNGPWLPVEFDLDADEIEIIACINGMPVPSQDHNRIWLGCARHPVEFEDYDFRLEKGHWRGELAKGEAREVGIGDNIPPPETPDALLIQELDSTKEWIAKTVVDTDIVANEVANKIRALQDLVKSVTALHASEKKPFAEKCDEIDEKYLPLIRESKDPAKLGRARIAIQFLKAKLNDFATKKADEAKRATAEAEAERQRKIKEATERAVAAAREAADAGRQGTVSAHTEPAPTEPVIPPELLAPLPPVAKQSFGGITGNKLSQRTKVVAVVNDQDALYQHLKDNPEVKTLLQKLAQKLIDAKMQVPGVGTKEESYVR